MPLKPDFDPLATCPVPFNLAGYVLDPTNAPAEKTALTLLGKSSEQSWSFADLRRGVAGYAAALRDMNVPHRAKVLMRVGNTVEFPLIFLACLAEDLIPIPTSTALSQEEVDWIGQDIAPDLVVASDGIVTPSGIRTVAVEGLKREGQSTEFEPIYGDPNRVGYIVYTSGSSGHPRAVAHAHRAIWARRSMWSDWYGTGPEDRILHAGAFNWTYTLGVGLLDPWAMGATALIPDGAARPDDLAHLLERSEATVFAAVPGIYRQLLKANPTLRLPNLRHGLTAGEALPERVRMAWRDHVGTELYEALGMSECSTFISAHPGRATPKGSVGYAQPGRKIAALAPKVPTEVIGAPGELAIHRDDPGLMRGYMSRDGELELPLDGDWFRTGDMVAIAADGAVTYLGRNDDMMNAGGFRVSPLEVEQALTGVEGITETAAVVVSVRPDVHVIALYYVAPAPVSQTKLEAAAAQHLARYKQPRLYIHRETLPKGGNGKLNRRALRAEYEASHDQA